MSALVGVLVSRPLHAVHTRTINQIKNAECSKTSPSVAPLIRSPPQMLSENNQHRSGSGYSLWFQSSVFCFVLHAGRFKNTEGNSMKTRVLLYIRSLNIVRNNVTNPSRVPSKLSSHVRIIDWMGSVSAAFHCAKPLF